MCGFFFSFLFLHTPFLCFNFYRSIRVACIRRSSLLLFSFFSCGLQLSTYISPTYTSSEMPPRIQQGRCLGSATAQLIGSPSPSTTTTILIPINRTARQQRGFSSTPAQATLLRNRMFAWLTGPGARLKYHLPGSTNYLSEIEGRRPKRIHQQQEHQDQSADRSGIEVAADAVSGGGVGGERRPFPLNPNFVSQSILSEGLRNEIHARVRLQGKSVREVSIELGVDMRRVGAVVRLVELENRWRREVCSFFLSPILFPFPIPSLPSLRFYDEICHNKIFD